MKAQAFLILVDEMLRVQADYFKHRRRSDLLRAKELEARARAVCALGYLEPDDAPANQPHQTSLFTEEHGTDGTSS